MKVKTFGALALAVQKIDTLEEPFTRKQYDAIAKKTGASSLGWLRDEGLLRLAKEEKFEIEKPIPYYRQTNEMITVYETENHAIVLSAEDYDNTPTSVLNYLVKENGAFSRKRRHAPTTEKISCVRYYYTLNRDKLETVIERGREELLERAEETIYECQEKIKKAQAIIDTFGDEE